MTQEHAEVFEAESVEALNAEIRNREWHGWSVHVLSHRSAVFSHPVAYDETGKMKRVVRDSAANQRRRSVVKRILQATFSQASFIEGKPEEPLLNMRRGEGVTDQLVTDAFNDKKLLFVSGGGPWGDDYGRQATQRFYVRLNRDDAYFEGIVVAIFDQSSAAGEE